MRTISPLSSGWFFSPSPLCEDWLDVGFSPEHWELVDLPHDMASLPFNHFDEASYQKKGCYYRVFESPEVPEGGRAFLDFEGVAVSCVVWLNGLKVGAHFGPYTPFSADITDALLQEGPNQLLVEVDGREDPSIPPFGGVVDYLVYGGIYRGVFLRVLGKSFIERAHAHPQTGPEGEKASLSVDVFLGGASGSRMSLAARLSRNGEVVAECRTQLPDAESKGEKSFRLEFPPLDTIHLWDVDSPELYDIEIQLREEGVELDSLRQRIGFRSARFTREGFFLNGRRIFLRGLNRHQSWPYSGYAMGPGAQRRDAEILKKELGAVIVRTSHYPQSRHFLDACDELGLLVFTELPGWQHIGDAAWKDRALADLGDLILRDRHHPSIVLWGVRVNESPDDGDFYARTNALAARLDPDRQRGGVRNFGRSELLEEVYTFNDFTHNGAASAIASPRAVKGKAKEAPYLITEHNGHMFPTKRFDQELRLAEHARRHARVLDAAMGDPSIAGAIGWCAFDYNTHKDFGSGDRVCYHGVTDMFRIPKYAAAFYASQMSPQDAIVLEPASAFAKGERDAAGMLPIEVYTNCEAVDLYREGQKVGRFLPDKETYPRLEHPPIVIDDLIGDRIDGEGFSESDKKTFLSLAAKAMAQGGARLGFVDKLCFLSLSLRRRMSLKDAEALVMKYGLAWGRPGDVFELRGILGGEEVAFRTFGADAFAARLELVPDSQRLKLKPGDEWDATRVTARALDQYGNLCRFIFEPLHISVSGSGRLVGPSEISLVGGATAFWIASLGEEGEIEVKVACGRFGVQTLKLKAGLADDWR